MDGPGDDLIFLVSQPRSGSTLLQYMLAGHPRIHTLPEPWFMLHFVYATRTHGIATEYDAGTAQRALADFLSALECGDRSLVGAIRAAASHLYGEALRGSGADIFLDKSPRYYFIAEELRAIFPRARMIFLVRNPLAVFSSILHTHVEGDWTALRRIDQMGDLVTAPGNMMRAIDAIGGERTALVRYEELVEKPDDVIRDICERIEIEYVPGLTNYVAPSSGMGDRRSTEHNAPVDLYVDRWKRDLDTSAKRDVAASYLSELGPELLERLGYAYDELMAQLGASRRARRTRSRWSRLTTADELLPWWRRAQLGFVHSRHQRGLAKTLLRLVYMAVRGRAWETADRRAYGDRRPV